MSGTAAPTRDRKYTAPTEGHVGTPLPFATDRRITAARRRQAYPALINHAGMSEKGVIRSISNSSNCTIAWFRDRRINPPEGIAGMTASRDDPFRSIRESRLGTKSQFDYSAYSKLLCKKWGQTTLVRQMRLQ